MKDIKRILSQKLRFLRDLKGLTQEQLAERAGSSGKFAGEIDRGTANPTIGTLENIVRALEVRPAQLMSENEKEKIISGVSRQDIVAIREALRILDGLFGS